MKEWINRVYTDKNRWILLLAQLLLLYVPTLAFFYIFTDNGTIPASACYFFSIIFLPYLIVHLKKTKLPPWYITFLFVGVIVLALVRLSAYGLSKSILHWLFGYYLLVVILNLGQKITKDGWMKMLEIAACCFAIYHFIFLLINHEPFFYVLNGYFDGSLDGTWGAILPSVTRGGRNLDATWLALGSFFVRKKKKIPYVTYALIFSFVGGSRVGMIAVALVLLWTVIYDDDYHLGKKTLKYWLLYSGILLIVLFASGLAQSCLKRFGISIPTIYELLYGAARAPAGVTNIEQFLSGRGAIWPRAIEMVRDNPWGYGVGNAMRVMRSSYGFTSYEDVVHNVFLQWTVDEGLIGGIWFLGLAGGFVLNQLRRKDERFRKPLPAFLLTYIVLSLVQFHGGEALMIFVLGVYLVTNGSYLLKGDHYQNGVSKK